MNRYSTGPFLSERLYILAHFLDLSSPFFIFFEKYEVKSQALAWRAIGIYTGMVKSLEGISTLRASI